MTDDRFCSKVAQEPNSGCWLWTACVNAQGYGMFRWQDRMMRAHRVSWELHVGPIPEGLHVLHTCDTPPCVNPGHLYLGSHTDNMRDCMDRGRVARGERNGRGGAKLTERSVLAIRRRLAAGATQRSLAAEYGVSQPTISFIKTGDHWAWL